MATLLNIIVFVSLTVGITAGEFCDSFNAICEYGCCIDTCCTDPDLAFSNVDYSLSVGAWVGIAIAVIICKVFFWVCCCYFCCRRRETVIVQQVMSPQATTVTVNHSQSHAGYDQPGQMSYATPMLGQMPYANPMPGPMPNGQYPQQRMSPGSPPPYEQAKAYPPPK